MQGCEQDLDRCLREPGPLVEVESIELLEAVEHDLSVGSSGAIVDLQANDIQQLACDSTHTEDMHNEKMKTGRSHRELEDVRCVAKEGDTQCGTPKELEMLTKGRGASPKEDRKESVASRLGSCVDVPWSSASEEDMTGGGLEAVLQVKLSSRHIAVVVLVFGFKVLPQQTLPATAIASTKYGVLHR